jgi:hypothetical protein
MADSLQQLGRASALAQIGFCGWQESVLATAAQINLGGLLAHSAIVPRNTSLADWEYADEGSHTA